MFKEKGNYKNGHNELTCSMCRNEEEMQNHILEEYTKVHSNEALWELKGKLEVITYK